MRLFVALPITEPASSSVRDHLARCRALAWPVRWARDEAPHLTLKFLGEVSAERLEAVGGAVRRAAERCGPIELALHRVGAFPSAGHARVLWLGIDAPPALELLQHRLECECAALGVPLEARLFRPHVTLGRVQHGKRIPERAVAALAREDDRTDFLADRVVLFESTAGRGAVRYQAKLSLELQAAP